MVYYSKEENIVTLRKESKVASIFALAFWLLFGIVLALGGLLMLYFLFNKIVSVDTNESMGIFGRILTLLLFVFPMLFISYLTFQWCFEMKSNMFKPKIIVIDILNEMISYKYGIENQNMYFRNFQKFKVDIANCADFEDSYSYVKAWIEGENEMIYFEDRTSRFDLLDLKYLSNYLGIPITKTTIEMTFNEYNEFRKKELEDRKSETREMYFL